MAARKITPLTDTKEAGRIIHIQRRPLPTHFSVEGYFQRVRDNWTGPTKATLFEVPFLSKGIWNRLRNIAAVFRLQADVYHVTGDIHYVCCLLPRNRCVLTVLDCEVLHRQRGLRRALLKYLWYTLPTRFCSEITVISEETKRQLLREIDFPESRIHVIPVSVSPLYVPTPRTFNSDCPRILQVGTKVNKNIPGLIRALEGIRCHLDIVGPVDQALRQQLQDCQINWTGWDRLTDQQMVERYQEADIVAFVSTHEGFGMPIVEAQSVERICITSNCSSMPEVAGEGACLVDPFDSTSIRRGMLRILSDSSYREAVLAAGRINRQRFDPTRIAQMFEEIYQSIVART